MMAAASGAVATAHPELADQVLALTAAVPMVQATAVNIPLWTILGVLVVVGVIVNMVVTRSASVNFFWNAVDGLLVLAALVAVGI